MNPENQDGLVKLTLSDTGTFQGVSEPLDSVEGVILKKREYVSLVLNSSRHMKAISINEPGRIATFYLIPHSTIDGERVGLVFHYKVRIYFDNSKKDANYVMEGLDAGSLLVRDDVAGLQVLNTEGNVIYQYLFRDPKTHAFLETHNSPSKKYNKRYETGTGGDNRDPLAMRKW